MKIYILCLFIGLSLSQQEFSFDNMSKKWKDYKLGNQEDFQIMVLEYIANLDPSQKVDNIKLHFWMIRSLYSDGKIEEAIENYNDLMKEIEEKTLFHEPYRDQMQQCKNSKCICDDMRKYDPNHNENLDLMSPESLKEHFANVWIVIGRDGKTIHPPEFRPDDFIGNSKIGKHIHQPSTPVNVNYGSQDNPKDVRFAILPKPFKTSNLSACNDFDCQLHQRAKWKRIGIIRDRYWNKEESKIRKLEELDELDFTDTLKVGGQVISKNGKYQYAQLVVLENNNTSNTYFPIFDDNNENDIINFHRLYVFNERNKYSRYSFKIIKGEQDIEDFGSVSAFDDVDLDNDYFVYIKWQDGSAENGGWFLSNFIDKNQFTLAIPNEYSKNYNIVINNKSYNTISQDQFSGGMKIVLDPDEENLLKYDDWDFDENLFKDSPDLINKDGKILLDTDLIEIRPSDFNNDDGIFDIKIEKEIDEMEESENKKSSRLIWYTVISSFVISAIK